MGSIFEDLESEVRSYSRAWPTVFDRASGGRLYAEDGTPYVDFFCGAGALNYGHNHPVIKHALLEYLAEDRVVHSLDMGTAAKRAFLERFWDTALKPRGLDYKVQFPGPTGTNAVEAALKLARKVTGRELVVGFTNAFHGMTLGALSVTGNAMKRGGAGVPLSHSTSVPFCNFLEDDVDSIGILRALLEGNGSGLDLPAAVIVETVQGEGGINVASGPWLRKVADLCAEHGILLVVDDVQMGCGRTGPFFSFEDSGVVPDIVTMAKSLSGIGLPLAVTLMRRDLDVWQPGEHNGTFRGNNPAMVTATAALSLWEDGSMTDEVAVRGAVVRERLAAVAAEVAADRPDVAVEVRGKGLVWGLALPGTDLAARVAREAFDRGVLVETSGPDDEVVKVMPPLVASIEDELEPGLASLALAVRHVVREDTRP
ncbi:MAG: diaminobutyrate--2-oxoglutarate transaminase [Acidimicrobiales bacterium]